MKLAWEKFGQHMARIGLCPRCMRQAFLAASLAWVTVVAAAASLGWAGLPTKLLTAAALALTALWVTHLVAFAVRMAKRKELCRQQAQLAPMVGQSRREFAMLFARAAVVSSLGVALTQFVAPAYAGLCRREGKPCTDCSDCCLCEHENCSSGCESSHKNDLIEQAKCKNNCTSAWLDCNKTC